ncbi:hydroxymethylglutaryl-CoA lyase [Alkalihalobacillus oceani]|uniref:Hydroxymethylglutaryl-CoA lyase n=1 Tax=Halalkalibacter oceani TaxID=1653776 RepID=A0A9X2DPB1_9BACI|nr:hydroxymethylglutaryl-CoA lyase [Halalkalibacter oceani]MCM3713958.1 hydroxymethylglutaryl-CoA lyase [Halalkalibacter oceani]
MNRFHLPKEVEIVEVGPRDGLQIESRFIPTEEKIKMTDDLSDCGFKAIQVTSVAHPKAVPQLADAEEVMAKIKRRPGTVYNVLVPNYRGAERAVNMNADEWELMLSVSDSHSISNANKTTKEALKEHEKVARLAQENGVIARGGMATALGCPFEGRMPIDKLFYVIEAYESMGIRYITVADTIGVADPKHVYETMVQVQEKFPDMKYNLHLHNTRGMALANIYAALQAGVTSFDTAIGGLGGCPYVPNATGNVATEDVVHMLELMGIETGLTFDQLIENASFAEQLVGHPLESAVYKAGHSNKLHDAPKKQVKQAD